MVKLYFHSRAAPTGTDLCPPRDFCGPSRGHLAPAEYAEDNIVSLTT